MKNILVVLIILIFSACEQTSTLEDRERQPDTLKNENKKIITEFDTITSFEAVHRIDQNVIVKGYVASVYYAEYSNGSPTFLNLEKAFPKNPIVVIIFEDVLNKLKINARQYENKTIIVKGKMIEYIDEESPYEEKPSIIIYSNDQIQIVD